MMALAAWALGSPLGRFVSGAALGLAIYLGARLWLAAHDASVRHEALVGYVQQSKLDAAEAKNAEIERQLAAGRKAAALYAEMLADAQAKDRADEEETAKRNADYEAKLAAQGRSCRITQSDRDFVRQP